MKIQVSQSNAPIWHDATVVADLPSKLKPLDILSKNLWWVWNSRLKPCSTISTRRSGALPVKIPS